MRRLEHMMLLLIPVLLVLAALYVSSGPEISQDASPPPARAAIVAAWPSR